MMFRTLTTLFRSPVSRAPSQKILGSAAAGSHTARPQATTSKAPPPPTPHPPLHAHVCAHCVTQAANCRARTRPSTLRPAG